MTPPVPDDLRATLADQTAATALVARLLPHADAATAGAHLSEIAALPLPSRSLAALIEALPRMADLSWTLLTIKRWLRAQEGGGAAVEPAVIAALAPVVSHGPWLARLVQRLPDLAYGLAVDASRATERPAEDYQRMAATAISPGATQAEAERALRALRNREMLRIASRELSGEDIRETMRELTNLASALCEAALAFAGQDATARFGAPLTDLGEPCRAVIMGMGKLGGGELNMSSDIDLIYLYETDEGGTDGVRPPDVTPLPGISPRAVSLHEYHARMFETVGALLGRATEDGFCFRVDLGLRPEGMHGPVCNSIAAAEAYYEQWGHAWERVAWLRARPVAGALALGASFLEAIRPFVYRRSLDPGAIDEIGRMKVQIDQRANRATRPGEHGFDLKLGEGGIREIEFFVNALQLVWGGRAPHVRDVSTLRALDRLMFAGLIRPDDHEALRDAYVLYRRIEHRLQMREDRQVYELPADAPTVDGLARGMGIHPAGGVTAGEQLLARIGGHARRVSAIFRGLLDSGSSTPDDEDAAADAWLVTALDERAAVDVRQAALRSLGFPEPDAALDLVRSLQHVPSSPLHVRHVGRQGALARTLLREVARSSAPNQALLHVRDLIRTLPDRSSVYDLLRDSAPVLRMLVTLFAASPFLSRAIIRRPTLLDTLIFQGRGPARKVRAEMDAELVRLLATVDLGAGLDLCRRYHTEEMVRIGLLDIAGGLDVESVGHQLTDLADTLVDSVLRLTRADLVGTHGATDGELAIFGLGRLGAREMGYGSDLDILFVYGGSGRHDPAVDRHAWFTRLAQRLITNISCLLQGGRLYEVDTRLRPSGSRGPLVSSLDSLRAYHEDGGAAVWERQALLKCRFVAGDVALDAPMRELLDRVVFRDQPVADLIPEMRRIRMRVESEVAREGGGSYNLKLGRGGIMDIEHVVQLLQLVQGAAHPELRVRSTYEALRAIKQSRMLPAQTATTLLEAYSFLRRLENRIRVVNDSPPTGMSALDTTSKDVVRLARRMGYGDLPGEPAATQLLAHYERHTGSVRTIYDTLLPEGDHGRQD